ncbi:hypothetical protein BS47DRAFT_1368397 [Hydnum rufescens UP504]|uniref:Uncharacterized protein n=1 Tax=Hydnum rufescens UP504 TaxID=1448309 RepID=A0A9P6AFX4_9AGAM|nr:hypothetical protein BS47DRAFT_1368397 [Hydnum rufescens UP504]
MAPQSWAQGTRRENLNGYGPEYVAACKNHSQSQWFEKFYSACFVLYHISLPDDFELVPGATYKELSNPEALHMYEKSLTKNDCPRKVCKDDEDSSTNVAKDIFPVLLPESLSVPNSMVEFPGILKLCRKQLIHVYLALFYDERVKPAVDIQLAIDHNQPLPSRKVQWDDIIMQQQITKEKWLAKTIEIQQIVKERQMTDYENMVKVWEAGTQTKVAGETQVGPELKSQGDMVVTCMHQGVMPGSHPIDFNTFATSLPMVFSLRNCRIELIMWAYKAKDTHIGESLDMGGIIIIWVTL